MLDRPPQVTPRDGAPGLDHGRTPTDTHLPTRVVRTAPTDGAAAPGGYLLGSGVSTSVHFTLGLRPA